MGYQEKGGARSAACIGQRLSHRRVHMPGAGCVRKRTEATLEEEGEAMKRILAVGVVWAIVCLGCAGPMKCHGKAWRHAMEKGGMPCCCPMHAKMAERMLERSIVTTGDGGVVVMTGNKLVKYDKDLNVQKEAELKLDMEGMQKAMTEMQASCPMYKKMSEKHGRKQKGEHKWHKWNEEREEHEGEGE